MAKYNRLCVSISDETNTKLDSIVANTNKRIKALSKSAVVELALVKFFDNVNAETISDEFQEQLIGDSHGNHTG